MVRKIDRTGEVGVNKLGDEMIIIAYRKYADIDVYFPKYNWTFKHSQYINFKNGSILCPYEPTVFGIGYVGEGKYSVWEDGKVTNMYDKWHKMLQRCYSMKFQSNHPTYINCTVCEEWHNFQNFAQWYEENYYEIDGEQMELDKDILNKKNKIYSPQYCVFVPKRINTLFVKNDKARSKYGIGVTYSNNRLRVRCNNADGQLVHIGCCDTTEEAFIMYKEFKESVIKQLANEYKTLIPTKLYNAMYSYEVEKND